MPEAIAVPLVSRLMAALGVALLLVDPVQAATCSVAIGSRISLRSSDYDPDVFVWDARQRAIDYAGGYWKSTADVMNHTLLSAPGTRAVVVSCEPAVVHSKYAQQIYDAIGIKLVSGPNRGRFGWVTSEDVHRL